MIRCGMLDLCRLVVAHVIDLFRPRAAIGNQILVLWQQIIVLRQGRPGRVPLLAADRMVLGWVYRLFPKTREALAIVRPDTVVRWHRAGFRRYRRWKSRRRWGRPGVPAEIRQLIQEMSVANPLWDAPRIHGELVKLDIDIGQTSVTKYMARRRGPDGGSWLGAGYALSDPRSGCLLRQYIRSPCSIAWHSRSSHICTLTMAKRVRRAVDRLETARMPGPHRGERRAAPSPNLCVLHGVL
jgi:hypothetical protein